MSFDQPIRVLSPSELDSVGGGPAFAIVPIVKAIASGVKAGVAGSVGSSWVKIAAGAGFTAGVAVSSAQGPRDDSR